MKTTSPEWSEKLVKAGWEDERWKDILGFEGIYLISDHGRVKSIKRRGNSKTRILKNWPIKTGYLAVSLFSKNISTTRKLHRLVAEAFIPRQIGKDVVNHLDGNKQNNHYTNLEWCTIGGNQLHAYAIRLRNMRGEANSNHVLTEREVSFIRYIKGLYPEIMKKDVSDFFGVCPDHIGSIWGFRSWNK